MAPGHVAGFGEQGRLPDACVTPNDQYAAPLTRARQQTLDDSSFRRTTDKLVLCLP
jgi:hypothetical protein